MLMALILGLIIAYIDDFKNFAYINFGSVRCEGYAFGKRCEFCGISNNSTEHCEADPYELDWVCRQNATHKYLGARCTFVCVTRDVKIRARGRANDATMTRRMDFARMCTSTSKISSSAARSSRGGAWADESTESVESAESPQSPKSVKSIPWVATMHSPLACAVDAVATIRARG